MCVFLQITITFGHKKETLIKNHFTRRCMTHPVIFSLFVSFLKICVCEFRNHLRRTWDYFFSFFFFLKARFALSVSFCFFFMVTSVVLSTTPARCCSFSSFVLAWLLFTLFALMLIFGVASFVSFLLACLLLFFSLSLSLVFFFSLSSSACLPALALTGGYSSLGWAETASLYNTDRLLCNQIPSVATSEDSLSRFLLRAHTQARKQAHAHTPHLCFLLLNIVCAPVCVYVCAHGLCTVTRVLTIIPPDSFLACREEATRVTFPASCFFHWPCWGFKGHCLQVSMFVLCVRKTLAAVSHRR